MWISLEAVTILKRAGLSLIGVHDRVTGRRLRAHKSPLPIRGESGATQPAKSGRLDRGDHRLQRLRTIHALGERAIAAIGAIRGIVDVVWDRCFRLICENGFFDAIGGRAVHRISSDERGGRLVTAANAGRGDDADLVADPPLELVEQRFATGEVTGDGFTDANRQRRGGRLALFYNVEVVIEGGDFEDFGWGKAHLPGKCVEVRRGEMTEMILELVEMLDQQVAPARRLAQ